jgi:hypothetical protein
VWWPDGCPDRSNVRRKPYNDSEVIYDILGNLRVERDGTRLILSEGSWKYSLAALLPASLLTTFSAVAAISFLNGGYPKPVPGTTRIGSIVLSASFAAFFLLWPLCMAIRLAFARCRYTFSRDDGMLAYDLEVFGHRVWSRRYPFGRFDQVRCDSRYDRSGSGYCIALLGAPWNLELTRAQEKKVALDLAEEVARITGIPLSR